MIGLNNPIQKALPYKTVGILKSAYPLILIQTTFNL